MTRFERRGRNVIIAGAVIAVLAVIAWLAGVQPRP